MQRYLSQLLTDLESATRNAPASSSYRFRHPFDDDERERSGYQLRHVRLSDLFNFAPGIFPPSEQLTKDQLAALLTAIEGLWRAWSIGWDCPPRLTARRRYTVMVGIMEQDTIAYDYELGAEINFCQHRAEGQCPFNDRSQCWCDELDACVQHDLDILENNRAFDEESSQTSSPAEELQQWLERDKRQRAPWDPDDEPDSWQTFMQEDDAISWLFFFDPKRNQDPGDLMEQPPAPEDFEDFDWHSEADEFDDLPF